MYKGCYYDTDFGRMIIKEKDGYIVEINMLKLSESDYELSESDLLTKMCNQLDEFFSSKRRGFDVPILFQGSEFQKKVWDALLKIPYGEVRTYKEQAMMIGNEKASRAVGKANGCNKLFIVVPCHRVIGSNGSLTGYAGGIEMKKYLLELESR